MQLSLITLILSVAVAAFAQTEVEDPVKMDAGGIAPLPYNTLFPIGMDLFCAVLRVGNIIPAAKVKRSQFEEFQKRQIDESIAVKMDAQGIIFPAVKRDAEPIILEVQPGTDLHEPVRMDAFGRIIKA